MVEKVHFLFIFYLYAESAERRHFLVTNASGIAVSIKKKTFCWLLNGEYDKLSNDRVTRFRGKNTSKAKTGSAELHIQSPDDKTIKIGDWCQFKCNRKNIVGQVLSFIFISKKTKKESRYSLTYALASDERVGVLANWFDIKAKKFKLQTVEDFLPIKNYLKHVEKPDINTII